MVPIINPNYPFEKMLEDIKNKKMKQNGSTDEQIMPPEEIIKD